MIQVRLVSQKYEKKIDFKTRFDWHDKQNEKSLPPEGRGIGPCLSQSQTHSTKV